MNRIQRRHAGESGAGSRRRSLIYATVAVAIVGIIVAVAFASRVPKTASDAPQYANIKPGDPAPVFAVSTTNGAFDLAHSGGKPTFLEVFATWCPHCQAEVAVINDLYAKYGTRVNFVGVSGSPYGMDQASPESQADVYSFSQKFGVKYPIAFDPGMGVAKSYLQGGFPTVVVIGKDNTIVKVESGEEPPKTLAADIDAALK